MMPRAEYEMSQEDLDALMEASKPTPVMMIGGYSSPSPQENANAAWARLGEKLGFDSMTVRAAPGKGQRFFTAIPSETDEAKAERLAQQAALERLAEIDRLQVEIRAAKLRLAELQNTDRRA